MKDLLKPIEAYQVPRELADIPTPGYGGYAGGGRAHRFWLHDRILVGGAILNADDGRHLRMDHGVTHVLSAESERHDRGKGFADERLCRIPFVDNGVNGPTEAQVHEALSFAAAVMAKPEHVLYTHCQLGGSRGPSMGYLVCVGVLGLDADDVVNRLASVHVAGERLHPPYRAAIDAGIASYSGARQGPHGVGCPCDVEALRNQRGVGCPFLTHSAEAERAKPCKAARS